MTTLAWLGFGVLGFALCAPLLYAISTLLGMRHKTVYPILRAQIPGWGSTARLRDGNSTERRPAW